MIRKTLGYVKNEFRGQEAFNDVARISSFHRIQLSPGYNDAARFIQSYLTAKGIQNELISFSAKEGVHWWSQQSFQEWKVNDAELVLLEDGKTERLCAFGDHKISLVQRSAATPAEGIKTTMVLVEKGDEPESYREIDVTGKLVFSRGNPAEIAKIAVDKFGAVGVVVDTMMEQLPVRDRFDLPDGRQYLAFWPIKGETHKAFGFVVSPRIGENLRRKFASGQKELLVHARVDAEFSDGIWKIPTAIIPGETEEEVVAVAHLCHPEPSANDNASGCGTLMETARTLSKLISSGKLAKPQRTIRFLWVPEMTGSYAFLAENEERIDKIVAAINLDMVGQNQALCGSTFTVERPVSALPGFGGDLAAAILGLMTKNISNLGGSNFYSDFRWTVGPFSGGSDHYIWGDPSVGVTCPMLIQWPDKFYHTSEDTIDKVDPKMLKVTGVLTATYLYTASNATVEDASFILEDAAVRFIGEARNQLSVILDRVEKKLSKVSDKDKVYDILSKARRTSELRIKFLARRKKLDVAALSKIIPDSLRFEEVKSEVIELINVAEVFLGRKILRELASIAELNDTADLPPAWKLEQDGAYDRAQNIIPKRIYRGPFSGIGEDAVKNYEEKLKVFKQKHGKIRIPSSQMQYWADGKRTLADIAELIESETGFDNLEALVDYFDLMIERGVFNE